MKRMSLILLLVLAGAVVGCAKFQVVNQDGLKAAYQDRSYAEAQAGHFKENQNVEPKDKDAAFNAYERARGKLNGYLESVKTKVSSTYVVNEPEANYTSTSAPAELEKFHAVVAKYQTKGAIDEGITAGGKILIGFIESIWKLKGEERKEALKQFETTINNNEMKPYAQVGSTSAPPKPGSTSGLKEPRK